jgi:hypothetical protein
MLTNSMDPDTNHSDSAMSVSNHSTVYALAATQKVCHGNYKYPEISYINDAHLQIAAT